MIECRHNLCKLLLLSILLSFTGMKLQAQKYEADWESLDKHPVPQWYKDAKFGIFIHWGVYSVPAWCPKGGYSEWYQSGLQSNDTARQAYHKKMYGDATYYQLADRFKAELFNPDEWAKLFEKSGAKYIVLTSKHHDGYALWPSTETNKTWGFPWTAVDVGPKRDLMGDLLRAVGKTSVKPGVYYSLYEWFNPLWIKDKDKFVAEHTLPQMKDIINNYKPYLLWTDGEWDMSDKKWRAEEFLAWLYNESPVKDQIVTYDRWGSGVRFNHGMVYTPEYQPDADFNGHYFEESRGMGHSYGYNKEEDAWDYCDAQTLILHLSDLVSRGGNFLLDIGPDADGKIPPIMQERLLQMGDWLSINGEAIYETTTWVRPCQWSEGNRDFTVTKEEAGAGGATILRQTINPLPDNAVKECFFTYNERNNTLYTILPKYPIGKSFTLKNIQLPASTNISFLATKTNLSWTSDDKGNVVITLPEYDPNIMKAPYAYVLKIENYGKYTATPQLKLEYPNSYNEATVSILSPEPGAIIYYTTDGSEPSVKSPVYSQPLKINTVTQVKAISVAKGKLPGMVASLDIPVYKWNTAGKVTVVKSGLAFAVYEGKMEKVAGMDQMQPVKKGITSAINLDQLTRKEHVGMTFEGYIKINKDELYTFTLASDDGSKLWINDSVVIDHDGFHGANEKSGSIALRKGIYKLKLSYIQGTGDASLTLKYNIGKISTKQELSPDILFHK